MEKLPVMKYRHLHHASVRHLGAAFGAFAALMAWTNPGAAEPDPRWSARLGYAQASFDTGLGLAEVPYDRVLELAPSLSRPRPNFPVVNFLDAGTAPLSVLLTANLDDLNIGIYSDGRYSYQLCIYVIRVEQETAVAVMFPDNPEAQKSVQVYLEAMKSVFERVADSGHWRNVA